MNQVATVEQERARRIVEFKKNLTGMVDRKELALPSNVSQEAFRNAAIVAVQDNPQILLCEAGSVFKALRKLAGAGLVPDGQEAAIVPFKGAAQAMPMVRGLRKIARNSGEISSLWDEVVYEGERLKVWVEDGQRKFDHTQADGSALDALTRGGEVVGAYAVAKLKDGTVEFLPMNLAQIEKRRMASPSQRGKNKPDGVWKDWFEEMARKTVIRALCNKLPMSAEDVRRIMTEDDANSVPLRDVTPEPEAPRKNAAQQIAEQAARGLDGEVLPPQDDAPAEPLDYDGLDLSNAFPGSPYWEDGAQAAEDGKDITDCPHDDIEKAIDWCGGWRDAMAKGGEE